MNERIRNRTVALLLSVLTLGGCENDATGPSSNGGAEQTQHGTVVGRVEDGSAGSSSLAPSYNLAGASEAASVAVARVQTDGELEVLVTGNLSTNGSYAIENVPAGIDRLVIVATSSAGAEHGRVILHQAVEAGSTVTAAPITEESTVEAHVFAELIRSGERKETVNTVELAQSIEVSSESNAGSIVQNETEIQALAQGVRARQRAYTAVLSARGADLDSEARFEAALPVAIAFARERHTGAEEKTAEAELDTAVAAALEGQGVGLRVQAEASAAAETALLRSADLADASARLDIARAAYTANLQARQRLNEEVFARLEFSAAERAEARQALLTALTTIDTAASEQVMSQTAVEAAARVQGIFEAHVSQNSSLTGAAQELLNGALQSLPSQADLQARLGVSSSGGDVARVYVAFFNDLRAEIQSAFGQLTSGNVGLDNESALDLFTSIRASIEAP